ncbi:protoporphyrinogen oxidase HemJ [Mucilaginibacter sp.]|uniref:protoporphyrinogen oxidase HemJ n=1 Tax=Mucilaginibacter sp. TaxID=1882438 RepID=UPI002845079B|nr:protoporphyrinogen oxidase HemJ [Mucilaginibacter sp.]MDR3693527.1 protoporphyrinogen oxidase HemJ [Mucilaginibacter sp.]
MYNYILSIHIIFVVCWFAGLFYMVRLFIYHTEAQQKPEPDRRILSEQFVIMERKLWYIITVPSMVFVVAAGLTMLYILPAWLQQPWMHLKLVFVVLLLVYHFVCQNIMKQMAKGIFKRTSTQLRLWNEVATILLFAIVFLAVLKNAVNWIYGLVGLVLLTILLMIGVKIYKRIRTKDQ